MHQIAGCAAVRALFLLMPLSAGPAGVPRLDPVIGEALRALPQPVNEVRVLSPPEVRAIFVRTGSGAPPAGLVAFRIKGDPVIYVDAGSEIYRDAARSPSRFHLLRLAATLMHEQVHDTDGEAAAYRRQADFVRSRIEEVPPGQRARARAYWRVLEVRAISFAKATAAQRRRATSR